MAIHHSTLAAVKRCPQKFKYAYVDKLERKRHSKNLTRGVWMHFILQVYALQRGLERGSLLEVPEAIETPTGLEVRLLPPGKLLGGLVVTDERDVPYEYPLSWEGALSLLDEREWAWLPEAAQEAYTEDDLDLPEQCRLMTRGYLLQHKAKLAKERPLLVEVEWERTDTSGAVPVEYGGRADLVLLDHKGRVTVRDWKTTASLPGSDYKLRERQRVLYAWGLAPLLSQHGLKVQQLELDYLIAKVPPKPQAVDLKKKPRLSTRKIHTTPPRYLDALREYAEEYGIEVPREEQQAAVRDMLAAERFFKRYPMPLNAKVVVNTLRENAQVASIAAQISRNPSLAYRVEDRSCDYMCDFKDICLAESWGQDASTIIAREFQQREGLGSDADDTDDEES